MTTNFCKQGKILAGIILCVLLAMPQNSWSEEKYIGGYSSTGATLTGGDGLGQSHSGAYSSVANGAYGTNLSNLGISLEWKMGSTTLDLSKVGSSTNTIKIGNTTLKYNAFASGTTGIYPSYKSSSLDLVGKLTFTAPDGVYFSDSTNFRIFSNKQSNTGYFAYNDDASNSNNTSASTSQTNTAARISVGYAYVFWRPIPTTTPVHSFYFTAKSSANYKCLVQQQWFYFVIPEVLAYDKQDVDSYGSEGNKGTFSMGNALKPGEETEEKTVHIYVKDGVDLKDFYWNIVNKGEGTYTKIDSTLTGERKDADRKSLRQTLTLTFKYTPSSTCTSECVSADIVVGSRNALNNTTYTISLTGTVVGGKETNNLNWNIISNPLADTIYSSNFLKDVNNANTKPIVITSSDETVCEVLANPTRLFFKKAGEDITLHVTQAEDATVGSADKSITIDVEKRTAAFAPTSSYLFTNKVYPNLIRVTNDRKGDIHDSIQSHLSYSGTAVPSYLSVDEQGNVTTNSLTTYNSNTYSNVRLNIAYTDAAGVWNTVDTYKDFKIVHALPQTPFSLDTIPYMSERLVDGVGFYRTQGTHALSWNGSEKAAQITVIPQSSNAEEFVMRFDGVPNKISFTLNEFSNSTACQGLYIGESVDGYSWSEMRSGSATPGTAISTTFSNTESRYVKIRIVTSNPTTSAAQNVIFKGLTISDKPSFTATPSKVEVQADGVSTTPGIIRVSHNDMQSITVTSVDDDFTIGPWTTVEGSAIGVGNRGVVTAPVDFIGSNLVAKSTTLTLTGVPSSGTNIVKNVTAELKVVHPEHYAKAQAYVVSESGTGSVFITAGSTPPADNLYGESAERLQSCDGNSANDNLTFYFWAKPADGFSFDGWYSDMEKKHSVSGNENYVMVIPAESKNANNPTTEILFANFEEVAADAPPIYQLSDLDLEPVVSGQGGTSGTLYLEKVGDYTRPLYIDKEQTTMVLEEIEGRNDLQYFSTTGVYSSGTKSFSINFNQTGIHPTTQTYQVRARVTATNIIGTTERTAIITATVNPAPSASFSVEASHSFGSDLQRNQHRVWDAQITNITNDVGAPTIAITGPNAAYFSVGDYDEDMHSFPITYAPMAVGGTYTATATISIKNYDEVATEHTITLTGSCADAPLATYDVQDAEGQTLINATGAYFGDFSVGDDATRKLYIVDLLNIRENDVPVISIAPEGKFTAAAYNPTTHSFDVTFTAQEGMTLVQNAVATIRVWNNDDELTEKSIPLSAFVVVPVEYDVRVTAANGDLIKDSCTWEQGLAVANTPANAGCTMMLMRNVEITAQQQFTNTVTLDLNGKKIRGKNNGPIILMNGAGKTLTIKDSKLGGRIENINNAYAGIAYGVSVSAGSVILHSGTIYVENKGASGRRAIGIQNNVNTSVTINGGNVEVYGYNDSYGINQTSNASNNTTLTINGGEIYVEGYQNIYGINAAGIVNVNGGELTAKATYRYSRGISMLAYADAVAANCYYGTLTMKGGIVNSINTADANGSREAYGIFFEFNNKLMGDAVATDGSHTNKATAIGTISNATINVSTMGCYAYGVLAYGSYNSKTNTYDKIKISNTTINATANYYYSYGVYAYSGINGRNWNNNDAYSAAYAANIELTDCEVNATTTKYHTAYGVWATTASNTVFQNIQPKYYGEYATGATVTINSGTYTATTGTQYAYAVGTSTRAKTIYDSETSVSAQRKLGEGVEGYATLNIHGGTFRANAGSSTARAVSTGGNCTIEGGEFYANTTTSDAYGVYCCSGQLKVTGVKIEATAKTSNARGIFVDAAVPSGNQAWTGFAYHGEAELNNLDVTATTTTGANAYGVFANSAALLYTQTNFDNQRTSSGWPDDTYTIYSAVSRIGSAFADGAVVSINGGTYTANAGTTSSYGIYAANQSVANDAMTNAAAQITVKNATFTSKTKGTTTAYGVYSGGNITIDGCKFTVLPNTTTARGVHQYSNKATITNTTFDVRATSDARLFYADAQIGSTTGWDYHGEFELGAGNVCTAQATGGNTAHILTLIANKRNIASGVFAGDYANASHAFVSGGSYKATATGTTCYALNLSAEQVQGSATAAPTCVIEGGKFWVNAAGGTQGVSTANSVPGNILIRDGIYNINTNLAANIPSGYDEVPIQSGRTDYTDGYRYEVAPSGPHGNYVCQIGSTKYKTLEEALQVVNSQVIYMISDYTLPAGDYVLPSGSTLLIPYKDGTGKGASTAIGSSAETTTSATTPYRFRKLTFANGANLTCHGIIETSAQQKANGQYGANVGMASGAYGQIHLEEGSHISLESGSKLYCWGFITGKGTIDAKKGSTSLEGFQLGDWCGGTNASSLIGNSQKVFPVTHYFYQSIECPITYRPGSSALGSTHINVSLLGTVGQDGIALVGTSGSMFIMDNNDMSKDTWVMKDYDETKDQCVWTINSGASIGNLTIKISSYNMASKDYDLPITTNMSIVLNYGSMGVGQNAVLLPGSKLIINKEGTAVLNGVNVVAYDKDDWTGTTRYFATYSPTWGTTNPRKSIALDDAEVFVHGKVNIKGNGGLYTSAAGANVHSTNEDAGEVIYTTAAQGNQTSYFLVQGGTTKTALTVNPVKLKNGNASYTASSGTVAGKTWTYMNNAWSSLSPSGCFFLDAQDHPYVKPADLVQVTSTTPDANHLHHDAATGTRAFVWDKDCYWWEVNVASSPGDGIYQSINPDHNGKYNYYEYNSGAGYWDIKNVTVTFNGESVTTTNYTTGYGTQPKWLGATPTKSGYVWDGWQIDGAGTVYANDELPVVTANTIFTAHFTEKVIQYNVTFKNDDGKVLDSRNWDAGATPSYTGTPVKEATASQTFTFNGSWSPAITTVSAAAEYTAQYSATTRQYTVTFLDYNNEELATTSVAYGVTPSYSGTPERIDPTDTYEYTFSGWKNQQTGATGLSAVTGDQTYVAQYTKQQKWYNICFADYNGTTLKTGPVLHETMPSAPADPSRERDAQYIYGFTGWSPTIATATANQTYTAQYSKTLRSYTIRFLNYDDEVLQTGTLNYGLTPEYTGATPTNSDESLEFVGWDDVMRVVSYDKDYVAQFTKKTYSLSIAPNNNEYGSVSETSLLGIEHGSEVAVSGNTFTVAGNTVTATPMDASAQYTYSFDHWNNLPGTITGNVDNIEAVFTRTLRTYTITWVDGNGTTLKTEQVAYGQTPAYSGATPTKTATAQYTYAFNNTWSPAITSVTGDATYTAQFGSTVNSYEITWLNDDDSQIDQTTVEYGVVPTHADASKANTAEWTYTFAGWDNTPVAVTGPATYKATFNQTKNSYTITWLNADESILHTTDFEYGEMPTYEGTPEQENCTFAGWTPDLTSVTGAATYTATYTCTIIVEDLDVPTTDHTVEINTVATTTTVHIDGTLTIPEGKTLETTDLVIEASADGSGEIDGIERVTVNGDTYFDLVLKTDAWHWSSFGVPFEIDLDEFAPLKDKTTPMVLGSDYDIVYYNALTRAQRGPVHQCWEYVEYQSKHKLIPGVAYLIAINRPVGYVDVVRFKKASTASINYSEPVEVVATGAGIDDSWNGIANPKIYHALLDAGVTECQVHNGEEIGSDGYTPYDMQDKKFFVGKAAFVQVPPAQSQVIITKADGDDDPIIAKNNAPRRSRAEIVDNRYDVQIAPVGNEMADRIYVLANDNKANEYVILSDLVKAGVSKKRAQIWVDRYGVKLCKNTAALVNNRADYSLSIYAPAAGEYTISIPEQPNDESMLYLTYNGRAIWNLSSSAYEAELEKGTNSLYGLRIVRKSPTVATSIEEATIENGDAVRKVVMDEKVYIIRNGEIYSVTGQKAQ